MPKATKVMAVIALPISKTHLGGVVMVQLPSFREIHPPKQTAGCNLKMGDPWKRRFLLETIISRFDVNFFGCSFLLDLFWLGILIFWKLKEGT